MDIQLATIRRENLRRLLNQYGTQKELAKVSGLVPAHISQIMGSKRNVGDGAAKRIEQKLELAAGWMDLDHQVPGEAAILPSAATRPGKVSVPGPSSIPSGVDAGFKPAPAVEEDVLDPLMRHVVDQLEGHGKTRENIRPDGLIFSPLGDFRVGLLVDDIAIDILRVTTTNDGALVDRTLARSLKLKRGSARHRYLVILCPADELSTGPSDRWTTLIVPRLTGIFEAAKEDLAGFRILPTAKDYTSIDGMIDAALGKH